MVSVFANDFGDFQEVLEGRGDWEEGGYWLNLIWHYCYSRSLDCVIVPAPWVNQIEGPQMAGNYPGKISNILESSGPGYLDPIAEFANAQLEIINNAKRLGLASQGSPLFNGRIGDGHFSARGCEVWAAAVGRRVALLIEKRQFANPPISGAAGDPPSPGTNPSPSPVDRKATPRSP